MPLPATAVRKAADPTQLAIFNGLLATVAEEREAFEYHERPRPEWSSFR